VKRFGSAANRGGPIPFLRCLLDATAKESSLVGRPEWRLTIRQTSIHVAAIKSYPTSRGRRCLHRHRHYFFARPLLVILHGAANLAPT
jgi:hypothetical protein